MRQPTREQGLFKNGDRWWLRVRALDRPVVRRSTGTGDLRLANRIAQMCKAMSDHRPHHYWLTKAADGDVSLDVLYARYSEGTLNQWQDDIEAPKEEDPDLEPWVTKWIAKLSERDISAELRRDYERQIRTFIPAGERFPRSLFNEDKLAEILHSLTDPRSKLPLTGSTKRRYLAPLRLFYRYARKRVPLTENPFEDADWIPSNNPPRMRYWDHETRLDVLSRIEDEECRVAATLLFGTGIELGPLPEMVGADINQDRTVVVRGTKNDARRSRTVFVDRWAWSVVQKYARSFTPRAHLFPNIGDGKRVREAVYEAQVSAGLIDKPKVSKKSGKKLWKAVDPHTLHDARHTYCYCRLLGLDGEARESTKFCAHQLGHGSEQMVNQIYAKANLEARIRQLAAEEAAA